MSSLRRLEKLTGTPLMGMERNTTESHCLVEWDEVGHPLNVVLKKSVKGRSKEGVRVGDICDVEFQAGSKKSTYPAKILGIGDKHSMQQMLADIEDEEQEEDQDSTTLEGQPTDAIVSEKDNPADGDEDVDVTWKNTDSSKCTTGRKRTQQIKPRNNSTDSYRVTQELLAGLDQSLSQDDQCHTSPVFNHLSDDDDYHVSSPSSTPLHSTSQDSDTVPPSKRPCTSDVIQMHSTSTPIHRRNTFTHPDVSLKEWLELQFQDLHRKIDAISEHQQKLESALLKRKNKKVNFQPENRVENNSCTEENVSELQVFCGDKKARGRYSIVTVPSRAALAEYNSVNSAPPGDAAKFALRLLGVFFTSEELARSNCTKAEGRELLDPEILQAIKHQTNLRYPVAAEEEERRWMKIVIKSLNSKCRSARANLRKTSVSE